MDEELEETVSQFETYLTSPKSLAYARINAIKNNSKSLGATFLSSLESAVEKWLVICKNVGGGEDLLLKDRSETRLLTTMLQIYLRISTLDATLEEEIGREGAHPLLSKIMKLDSSLFQKEEDQDCVVEIQDLAGEIAAMSSKSFPQRVSPLTMEELEQRLAITFQMSSVENKSDDSVWKDITILINQVSERQSAQQDVGFVMWPSAVALSRWILTNRDEIKGKTVLEIGAGCGLTGLVAAAIQKKQHQDQTLLSFPRVTLSDFNETVLKNAKRNIQLNGLEEVATTVGLDFYQQKGFEKKWLDMEGKEHEQVDFILGADIICQPDDSFAAARTISDALKPGGRAIVICGDSKHRFGVEVFEEACQSVKLGISGTKVKDLYDGKLLLVEGMELTTGYVAGMELTLFSVIKSIET
jgi:predicted nicotinamide N-methyase